MSSTPLLLLALLAPFAAFAQSVPNQAASADAAYTLTGTIQSSLTGEPIPHALVTIAVGSQASTFSDAGGRFEFDRLPAGITSVTARKPGFLDPSEVDPNTAPPTVRTGPDAAPVILKLVPEAVVFGRALKLDGEPIGYLAVQLFYPQIADGRKRWNLMNNTQTNEDGEFRIAGLRPGRYYLLVGPRWQTTWIGAPGQRAREAAYQPIFYPGVSDLASAAPIDVSPGQQLEADLTLSPEPVFRISGNIVGLPPNANPDEIWPRIQLLSRSNTLMTAEMAGGPVGAETGNEFRTKAPVGSYTLRAEVDTPQGTYRGEMPITVQSDMSGVNLMVGPIPPLRIEVVVQRTRPLANRRPSEQVSVHFRGQSSKLLAPEYESMANAGAINVINGVEPGAYGVDITPIGDLYVDSAQCASTDLLREDLMIHESPMPPIRISLRDDGGNIGGNVVSEGRGAPRATVLMIADRAPRQIKAIMAGTSGQFESGKLAPGDYTVLALDRVAGIEYANPEVMNAYLANAIHVSVTANGESRISVNLIQTAK